MLGHRKVKMCSFVLKTPWALHNQNTRQFDSIIVTNIIVRLVFYCILLSAFIGWCVGLGYKIQTMSDICNSRSIRSVFLCVATHYVCKCWTGDPCQHNDGGTVCRYNQTRQINPRLCRCPPAKHLDKQSLIKSWYNSIILNVNRTKIDTDKQ